MATQVQALLPAEPGKRGVPKWALFGVAGALAAAVVGVVAFAGGDDDTKTVTPAGASTTVSVPEASEGTTEGSPEDTTPGGPDVTAGTPAPSTTVTADPVPSGDQVAGAPAGQRGTLDAPVPAGQIADIGGGWRLQVLGVVPDATEMVATENEFNDPPPAGSVFTIVTVALGYYGLDDPASTFTPTIAAIGAARTELDANCGVIPGELAYFNDVFAGGVVQGNLCFVVPAAEAGDLTLYGVGDWFNDSDEIFLEVAAPTAPAALPALTGPQEGAAASKPRLDPTPLGTAVEVGSGWSVRIDGPVRDITDAILAENSFNEPPPEGFRFVGVDATYSYSGSEGASAFDVTMKGVGDANVEVGWECGVVPGEMDRFADVFSGGQLSGTLCFVVREGSSLVLYATAEYDLPAIYFATV